MDRETAAAITMDAEASAPEPHPGGVLHMDAQHARHQLTMYYSAVG